MQHTLTFTGNVTNNGVTDNSSVLESSGPMVINGKTLLFHAGTTDHLGKFINNGRILNANTVHLQRHPRRQLTPSLQPPAWTDSGPAQPGTGGVLVFTDSGAATNGSARCSRLRVQ